MRYRVFLKPFDDFGNYLNDYTEITSDVLKLSNISQKIEGSDFDVGLIKNNGVSLTLRNDSGRYGGPETLKSIFRNKRKNSLVRIEWDLVDYDLICHHFICGEPILGGSKIVFEGLLNDLSSSIQLNEQFISFTVLSFDSLLDETLVPFASISDGEALSSVLNKMLSQAPFFSTNLITSVEINLSNNPNIDVKASLENKTVGEVLKDLLFVANSCLYIEGNKCIVKGRTESANVAFNFYGQASQIGIENILAIPKYRDGLNRIFNYWTWASTTLLSQDATSVSKYGVLKKEIKSDTITNTTKRQTILDKNRDEFRNPKIELDLITPISYTALDLKILDKVDIDYPAPVTPADDNPLPIYGAIKYGEARYPFSLYTLTIDQTKKFKILGKVINTNQNTITFTLREI